MSLSPANPLTLEPIEPGVQATLFSGALASASLAAPS